MCDRWVLCWYLPVAVSGTAFVVMMCCTLEHLTPFLDLLQSVELELHRREHASSPSPHAHLMDSNTNVANEQDLPEGQS